LPFVLAFVPQRAEVPFRFVVAPRAAPQSAACCGPKGCASVSCLLRPQGLRLSQLLVAAQRAAPQSGVCFGSKGCASVSCLLWPKGLRLSPLLVVARRATPLSAAGCELFFHPPSSGEAPAPGSPRHLLHSLQPLHFIPLTQTEHAEGTHQLWWCSNTGVAHLDRLQEHWRGQEH